MIKIKSLEWNIIVEILIPVSWQAHFYNAPKHESGGHVINDVA